MHVFLLLSLCPCKLMSAHPHRQEGWLVLVWDSVADETGEGDQACRGDGVRGLASISASLRSMGGKRKKHIINTDLHAGHLLPYLSNYRLTCANTITLSNCGQPYRREHWKITGVKKISDVVDREGFFSSISLRTVYEILTEY